MSAPEEGLFRNDHPETSVEAARAVAKKTVADRARIEGYLKSLTPDGASDRDLQDHLPMESSTERPRRVELVRAGIVKAGPRVRQHGRMVIRWVWVPPAEREVAEKPKATKTAQLAAALANRDETIRTLRAKVDQALRLMEVDPRCTRGEIRRILEATG